MRVHHIGIVVKDIEKNIHLYTLMGYEKMSDIVVDEEQNNQVILLNSESSPIIELIQPLNKFSSVYNFKEGYHHICYESENNEDIIPKFKKMNIGKIFTKPIVAPAIDNREVVFACLRNGMFVEFII